MKKLISLLSFFIVTGVCAQTYPSVHINLLGHIDPVTPTITTGVGNKYSGCWGWYQASKNKEYAISGAADGTYFIDVTNPTTPTLSAFVKSISPPCTWREVKTYQNYCYVVSDVCTPNGFQIIDMQYLPDSVHVIHSSDKLFQLGHTIWIDKDKMYVGLTTFTGSGGTSPMSIWSLATPTAPVLLRRSEQDAPGIGGVHDMYVRNDTIYASAGNSGLHVFRLTASNTLAPLGSFTGYHSPNAYNHSGFLTKNGKYFLFADEAPASLPLHLLDVQNLANMQPMNVFNPNPLTTPHNPYILGNSHAVISCYMDGLYIYDISEPPNIFQVGYFDTYPQGGANTGTYAGTYGGNWGAYPFLPSGRIIATDMLNGIFVLDASKALNNKVGIDEKVSDLQGFSFFPNPAKDRIAVHYQNNGRSTLSIHSMLGSLVYSKEVNGDLHEYISVQDLAAGTYVMTVKNGRRSENKMLVITH